MKHDISNSATAVKDPVCGMNVNPATAKHHLEHAGTSYYFCSAHCAEKFKADPQKYLSQPSRVNSSSLITLGASAIPPTPAQQAPSANQPSANRPSAEQANYVCP